MRIRRATARDLPRILAIEQSCFARDAWNRQLFTTYLNSCPRGFVVGEYGRAVAAYAIVCVRRNQGEIESIAVSPRYARRGIGTALVRFSLGALRRARVRAAALMVESTNDAAIAFYRGLGFRRTRTVRHYYGRGRHGWRMRLLFKP